jgi:hypothetical protein
MPRKVKLSRENLNKLEQDALLITVGIQQDGATYGLEAPSKRRIREAYPQLDLLRAVFLGHYKDSDFDRLHPPRWKEMALLLTGLSEDQIAQMGGVRLYSPEREEVLWEWKPAAVTSRG